MHGAAIDSRVSDRLRRSVDGVNLPKGNSETKRRRGGIALRSSASRNGPLGLCLAESFGNSFEDSVSFRFPSWQSLDGRPVPPANCAQGSAAPAKEVASKYKNKKVTGRLQACHLNASPGSVSILLHGGAS